MLQTTPYYDFKADEQEERARITDQLATYVTARLAINEDYLRRAMPNLLQDIKSNSVTQFRTFVTRFATLNLLDEQTHQLLYSEDPSQQCSEHIGQFLKCAPTKRLDKSEYKQSLINKSARFTSKEPDFKVPYADIREDADVLVMLGIGLGYALKAAVEQSNATYIIVYEPHLDMLKASLETIDWQQLMEKASSKGMQVFIQPGNDGSSLKNDLAELAQHAPVSAISLYRHYPDVRMDDVFFDYFGVPGESVPLYSVPKLACLSCVPLSEGDTDEARAQAHLQRDVSYKLLAKSKPHMKELLQSFKRTRWLAYFNQFGELNAFDTWTGWPLYNDAESIQQQVDKKIVRQKNMPYRRRFSTVVTPSILYKYEFNKLTAALTEETRQLRQQETMVQLNRDNIFASSLFFEGIGLGYGISEVAPLWSNLRDLQMATMLESDIELLQLSLCASDWLASVASVVDLGEQFTFLLDEDRKGYYASVSSVFFTLNGSSVGASERVNFIQSARNDDAVQQFMRAFSRILTLGKFDESRFHLSQALANIENGQRFLSSTLQDNKSPIVVVGNGPSVDINIEWIKANRDNVVVVSCGTSLYTLYNHGICPDFHAEVEIINVMSELHKRIPSEFLQKVCLLATASSHPNTVKLFGKAYLAFRAGLDVTRLVKNSSHWLDNLKELEDAAPTCTNLALSFFLAMGYRRLYLCGVDLAATPTGQHHANNSYFNDDDISLPAGFSEAGRTPMMHKVEGYNGALFDSKPEFINAIDSFEILISKYPTAKIVNLSKGALIPGTTPQDQSEVPIESTLQNDDLIKRVDRLFLPLSKEVASGIKSSQADQRLLDFISYESTVIRPELYKTGNIINYFVEFNKALLERAEHSIDFLKPMYFYSAQIYFSLVLSFIQEYFDRTGKSADDGLSDAAEPVMKIWFDFLESSAEDFKNSPWRFDEHTLNDAKIVN
ncbi:motility associated factor glycosyltransferase family protein [Aliidiomarina sp. Khilg15.8]